MKFLKGIIFLCVIFLLASCSKEVEVKETSLPTIRANPNSAYSKTFKDLHLGEVLNFDLRIPNADKRWVELWVDRYVDGVKEPNVFASLQYGNSPDENSEDTIGYGFIHSDNIRPVSILYASGISGSSALEKSNDTTINITTWMYAVSEKKKKKLPIGKTVTLGVLRDIAGKSIRMYDLAEKDALKKIIHEDHQVLVLNIKITDSK